MLTPEDEWARPAHETPITEGEVDSRKVWLTTSCGRDLQTGLHLQKRSTRAVDGVLHRVGERALQLQRMMSIPEADGLLQQKGEPHTALQLQKASWTESGRSPQRGLQLQREMSTRMVGGLGARVGEAYRRGRRLPRMMSTPAADGLLQQVRETRTQDSCYRGRGGLAQQTVYCKKGRNPQRGLQLQRAMSTRTVVDLGA